MKYDRLKLALMALYVEGARSGIELASDEVSAADEERLFAARDKVQADCEAFFREQWPDEEPTEWEALAEVLSAIGELPHA